MRQNYCVTRRKPVAYGSLLSSSRRFHLHRPLCLRHYPSGHQPHQRCRRLYTSTASIYYAIFVPAGSSFNYASYDIIWTGYIANCPSGAAYPTTIACSCCAHLPRLLLFESTNHPSCNEEPQLNVIPVHMWAYESCYNEEYDKEKLSWYWLKVVRLRKYGEKMRRWHLYLLYSFIWKWNKQLKDKKDMMKELPDHIKESADVTAWESGEGRREELYGHQSYMTHFNSIAGFILNDESVEVAKAIVYEFS